MNQRPANVTFWEWEKTRVESDVELGIVRDLGAGFQPFGHLRPAFRPSVEEGIPIKGALLQALAGDLRKTGKPESSSS